MHKRVVKNKRVVDRPFASDFHPPHPRRSFVQASFVLQGVCRRPMCAKKENTYIDVCVHFPGPRQWSWPFVGVGFVGICGSGGALVVEVMFVLGVVVFNCASVFLVVVVIVGAFVVLCLVDVLLGVVVVVRGVVGEERGIGFGQKSAGGGGW